MSYGPSQPREALSTRRDGDSSSSNPPSAEQWAEKKAAIHSLYITKKLPLKAVISHMERDHQFKATFDSRMYKLRLANWGFQKNISYRDWQAAAVLLHRRENAGERTTSLEIHGWSKSLHEYHKHIRTCRMTEKKFLENALSDGVTVPEFIRAVSHEPDDSKISSTTSLGEQSSSTGPSLTSGVPAHTPLSSSKKSSRSNGPQRSQAPARFVHVDDHNDTVQRTALSPVLKSPLLAAKMPDILAQDSSCTQTTNSTDSTRSPHNQIQCDHVQQDMGLILAQTYCPDAMTAYPDVRDLDSWELITPPDSMAEEKLCTKCRSPSRDHQPLPPDWVLNPSTELPQRISYQALDPRVQVPQGTDEASIYQACCFSACIYGGQEKYDLLAKSLQQADLVFRKMLSEGNNMALLSVLLTLTILHAHDQGSMAASIIRSAHHVSFDLLGEGNPVSLSIEWLTAAAGRKLNQCRIKTPTLRAVHYNMKQTFGEQHQNTIVALYCLSFNLIRDKEFAEAEKMFTYMSEICEVTLGYSHIQTISSLNGLSRSQSRLEKFDEAISTMRKSISRHPLGPNHPYRLESLRRLAILYQHIDRKDLMEPIYWSVLKGRIKTLGKKHSFTEESKDDLCRLLKELGKWDDDGLTEGQVELLFDDGTALTSDIESF